MWKASLKHPAGLEVSMFELVFIYIHILYKLAGKAQISLCLCKGLSESSLLTNAIRFSINFLRAPKHPIWPLQDPQNRKKHSQNDLYHSKIRKPCWLQLVLWPIPSTNWSEWASCTFVTRYVVIHAQYYMAQTVLCSFYCTGFAQAWKVLEFRGLSWKLLEN